MENEFKIKITDEDTGQSDILNLDVRYGIDIQLSVGVFGKVIMRPPGPLEGSTNYLLFIASTKRDYETKTLYDIVKAVVAVFGGSLVWELSSDRPTGEEDDDIQAYLMLNTRRYSTGGD